MYKDRSGQECNRSLLQESKLAFHCRTIVAGPYRYTPKEKIYITSKGIKFFAPSLQNDWCDVPVHISLKEVVRLLVHFGEELPVIFFYTKKKCGAYIKSLDMKEKPGPYSNLVSKNDPSKRITLFPELMTDKAKKAINILFPKVMEELSYCEAYDLLARSGLQKYSCVSKMTTGPASVSNTAGDISLTANQPDTISEESLINQDVDMSTETWSSTNQKYDLTPQQVSEKDDKLKAHLDYTLVGDENSKVKQEEAENLNADCKVFFYVKEEEDMEVYPYHIPKEEMVLGSEEQQTLLSINDASRQECKRSLFKATKLSFNCRTIIVGPYGYAPKDKVYISPKEIKFFAPSLKNVSKTVAVQISMEEVVRLLVHFGNELPVIYLYTRSKCGAYIRKSSDKKEETGPYYNPVSKYDPSKRITLLTEPMTDKAKNAGPYYNPVSKYDPSKRITLLTEPMTDKAKNAIKILFAKKMDELSYCEANDLLARTGFQENSSVSKMTTRSASASNRAGGKRSNADQQDTISKVTLIGEDADTSNETLSATNQKHVKDDRTPQQGDVETVLIQTEAKMDATDIIHFEVEIKQEPSDPERDDKEHTQPDCSLLGDEKSVIKQDVTENLSADCHGKEDDLELYPYRILKQEMVIGTEEQQSLLTANETSESSSKLKPCNTLNQHLTSSTEHHCGEAVENHAALNAAEQTSSSDISQFHYEMYNEHFSHNDIIHENTHNQQVLFACEVCTKQFKRKEHLTVHKRIHSGEKIYNCSICREQFADQRQLTIHEFSHTGGKPFRCEFCPKQFTRNEYLTVHKRIHSGERPFHCRFCEKQFMQKSLLKVHERIHTGEKPYSCGVCNKQFAQKFDLNVHRRVHSGEKPFQCGICSRDFSDKRNLKRHERTHSADKPFQCRLCKKQFAQKYYLVYHERAHTGVKPFECQICKKQFLKRVHLAYHELTHSGEKAFHCEVCKKQFVRKGDLTRHSHVHSADKPFHCRNCTKQFSEKWKLIRHERSHNP